MKKTIKRILGVIGLLFAGVCVFVLVGAFNPEFTKNLMDAIENREDYRKEELSGTIPGTGSGDFTLIEEPEIPAATIEEGYDENGLRNPYSEKLHYVLPEEDLKIDKDVAGFYGYLPMAGRVDLADSDLTEEEKYGETGEKLQFDTLYYPYYGMLSDALQRVYKQVYANAEALNATFVPVENLSAAQMKNVMEAVYNDHPELFWLDTAYSCKYYRNGICKEVTLRFNWTADKLEHCRREFTDATNDIIYGANNYTEDFEKVRYVHDALLGRIEYNLAANIGQSAYSGVVNKETVCAGYARAYQYILQKLDIPCYYCTGYAGENHAWNIVRLGKSYYNVDVTWDDVTPGSYKYFTQTDEVFAKDHVRTGLSVYLPACKGTKYQDETAGRKPNTWQNSSGNFTDNSGKVYYIGGAAGDGLGYDGTPLTSLEEYYENCKSQLSKGGIGTVIFNNVVDSATLKEIYEAYDSGDYRKGYLTDALRKLNAKEGKVSIQISLWGDDENAKTDEDKENGNGTTGTTESTTTESATGTTESGTGTTESGTGTTESGTGTTESGAGTTESGTGTTESSSTEDSSVGSTNSSMSSTNAESETEEPEPEPEYVVEEGKLYLLRHVVVIE